MCQLANIIYLILLVSILILIIYISIVQVSVLCGLARFTFWSEVAEVIREQKNRQKKILLEFSSINLHLFSRLLTVKMYYLCNLKKNVIWFGLVYVRFSKDMLLKGYKIKPIMKDMGNWVLLHAHDWWNRIKAWECWYKAYNVKFAQIKTNDYVFLL